MAITSADIQNQSFKIERRGYDVDEVDVFLERVSSEIDALNNEVASLRTQVKDAKRIAQQAQATQQAQRQPAARPAAASTKGADAAALARKDARIAELEAKLKDRKNEDSAIAQALIIAQRTGDEIVSKAKAEAEQTRQNGEEEARRILDKANAEKERIVEHINDLNASREQVREQYQDLLKEFIGSATKRLTEIGGDITEGFDLPQEASDSSSVKWEPSPTTATYTTPTVSSAVSAPAAPKPSAVAKDLSGYGDADDSFAFDEID